RRVAEVDDLGVWGNGSADRGDAISFDDNRGVADHVVRCPVEEARGLEGDAPGLLSQCGRGEKSQRHYDLFHGGHASISFRTQMRVAYQGERGAFSETAARRLMGAEMTGIPCPSFEE